MQYGDPDQYAESVQGHPDLALSQTQFEDVEEPVEEPSAVTGDVVLSGPCEKLTKGLISKWRPKWLILTADALFVCPLLENCPELKPNEALAKAIALSPEHTATEVVAAGHKLTKQRTHIMQLSVEGTKTWFSFATAIEVQDWTDAVVRRHESVVVRPPGSAMALSKLSQLAEYGAGRAPSDGVMVMRPYGLNEEGNPVENETPIRDPEAEGAISEGGETAYDFNEQYQAYVDEWAALPPNLSDQELAQRTMELSTGMARVMRQFAAFCTLRARLIVDEMSLRPDEASTPAVVPEGEEPGPTYWPDTWACDGVLYRVAQGDVNTTLAAHPLDPYAQQQGMGMGMDPNMGGMGGMGGMPGGGYDPFNQGFNNPFPGMGDGAEDPDAVDGAAQAEKDTVPMQIAMHELGGVSAYLSAHVEGLHPPLMCLVDHRVSFHPTPVLQSSKYKTMYDRRLRSLQFSDRLTRLLGSGYVEYMGEDTRWGGKQLITRGSEDFGPVKHCGEKILAESLIQSLECMQDADMGTEDAKDSFHARRDALAKWARGRFQTEKAEVEADEHIAAAMASDTHTLCISNDTDMILGKNSRVCRVDDVIKAFACGTEIPVYTSKYLSQRVLGCREDMLPIVSWACFNDTTSHMRPLLSAFWTEYDTVSATHPIEGVRERGPDQRRVTARTGPNRGSAGWGANRGTGQTHARQRGGANDRRGGYGGGMNRQQQQPNNHFRSTPTLTGGRMLLASLYPAGDQVGRDHRVGERHMAVGKWCSLNTTCTQANHPFVRVLAEDRFRSLAVALVCTYRDLQYPLPETLVQYLPADEVAPTVPTPSVEEEREDGGTLSLLPPTADTAQEHEAACLAFGVSAAAKGETHVPDVSMAHKEQHTLLAQALADCECGIASTMDTRGFMSRFIQTVYHKPEGYGGRPVPQFNIGTSLLSAVTRSLLSPEGGAGYITGLLPVPTAEAQSLIGDRVVVPFSLLKWRDMDLSQTREAQTFSALGYKTMDVPFRLNVSAAHTAMQSGAQEEEILAALFAGVPGYPESTLTTYGGSAPTADVVEAVAPRTTGRYIPPSQRRPPARVRAPVPEPVIEYRDSVELTMSWFQLVLHPFRESIDTDTIRRVVCACMPWVSEDRAPTYSEVQVSLVTRTALLTYAYIAHLLNAMGMPLSELDLSLLGLLLDRHLSSDQTAYQRGEVASTSAPTPALGDGWATTGQRGTPGSTGGIASSTFMWASVLREGSPAPPKPPSVYTHPCEGTGPACLYGYIKEVADRVGVAHECCGMRPGTPTWCLMDGEMFLHTVAQARRGETPSSKVRGLMEVFPKAGDRGSVFL
ncbi:hypothetical protein KIPB_000146 [Kipferlia bialata]|uniref:Clu domain-containing protein n=1 Tax=Kipferlia bialata TaxID=797122 RepID=A0A9K3GEA4_9EUKA|nr:hypothetical protein KIPB_000146 [Kipferlia bialata]|eukprot:g146.t1